MINGKLVGWDIFLYLPFSHNNHSLRFLWLVLRAFVAIATHCFNISLLAVLRAVSLGLKASLVLPGSPYRSSHGKPRSPVGSRGKGALRRAKGYRRWGLRVARPLSRPASASAARLWGRPRNPSGDPTGFAAPASAASAPFGLGRAPVRPLRASPAVSSASDTSASDTAGFTLRVHTGARPARSVAAAATRNPPTACAQRTRKSRKIAFFAGRPVKRI